MLVILLKKVSSTLTTATIPTTTVFDTINIILSYLTDTYSLTYNQRLIRRQNIYAFTTDTLEERLHIKCFQFACASCTESCVN